MFFSIYFQTSQSEFLLISILKTFFKLDKCDVRSCLNVTRCIFTFVAPATIYLFHLFLGLANKVIFIDLYSTAHCLQLIASIFLLKIFEQKLMIASFLLYTCISFLVFITFSSFCLLDIKIKIFKSYKGFQADI